MDLSYPQPGDPSAKRLLQSTNDLASSRDALRAAIVKEAFVMASLRALAKVLCKFASAAGVPGAALIPVVTDLLTEEMSRTRA